MSLRRIWQSALSECLGAIRSRRAIVILVLYLVFSLLGMNGSITVLGKMEEQLTEVLQLESGEGGKSGVVSATVWKSKPFQKMAKRMFEDSLVYDDICGKHPAELIYAWFAFLCVPLLTILIAGNRVADDLGSGSVRYMLTRVTRLEWSLGKYVGLALMMFAGLLLGAVAGWITAAVRLGGADIADLMPAMLGWMLKAWVLSLAWLGFALGVSHLFRSGAKALALSIVLMVVWGAAPKILAYFGTREGFVAKLSVLARLFPGGVDGALWRTSFAPVATTSLWLLMLGLLYLSAGYSVFARRDAR